MCKYLVLILSLTLTTLSVQAQTNYDNKALNDGLKMAQSFFTKAISLYDTQPMAIDNYVSTTQDKLNLKDQNRLKIIKRAFKNSSKVKLIIVDNSIELANERRECVLGGADAMVKKTNLRAIYICPKSLRFSTEALAQVIIHELIHTAESRHERNECETSWSEHIVMLLSGAGNPYDQQYYNSCGFFKPQKKNQPQSI